MSGGSPAGVVMRWLLCIASVFKMEIKQKMV
jgi:hypothetical protein